MNLFSSRLRALPHLAVLDRVPGSERARYATDDEGGRWVYKTDGVLAEALAQLLGRWLHAPVPEGALYQAGWASRWTAGLGWSPLWRDRIHNPDEVGAMLTLDVLLLNEHRTARDLLVVPSGSEVRLTVLALDWSRARLTGPPDALPSLEHHARGLPVEALREGALAAAGVAERLEPQLLQEFVAESCSVARSAEASSLGAALQARCQRATALVTRHLEAVP